MKIPSLLYVIASTSCLVAAPPSISITDTVAYDNMQRIGYNLDFNAYWGTPAKKITFEENFEGTTYRFAHTAYKLEPEGAVLWSNINEEMKKLLVEKGTWRILSGPNKGASGKIKDFTSVKRKHRDEEKDFLFVVFDKPVTAGPDNSGIALEVDDLEAGRMHPQPNWSSPSNEMSTDVPPEVGGKASLLLKGSAGDAFHSFVPANEGFVSNAGTWNARFWAKSQSENAQLIIDIGRSGPAVPVPLSSEWKHYNVPVEVTTAPTKPNGFTSFKFMVKGADVLLDNLEIFKGEHSNSSTFTDTFVDNLRLLRPGLLRSLQMGGQSMEAFLQLEALQRPQFSSMIPSKPGPRANPVFDSSVGLPELLLLCEETGANPWINLPGVVSSDEITLFLEYMGAPSDVGAGKLRASQGREKPWTDSFDTIVIEYGNEAWNFSAPYQLGGYNGPDYWESITRQIRQSPFTSGKYHIASGVHSVNTFSLGGFMKHHPSADSYASAPYWVPGLRTYPKEFFETLEDDAFLMKFAAASIHRTLMDPAGYMHEQLRQIHEVGKQASVYEVNYTGWKGLEALSEDRRNAFMFGWGAGLVNANGLLLMQSLGVRAQVFFTVTGKVYGAVSNMTAGEMVTRPVGEALRLANELILPEMLQTNMTGDVPLLEIETQFETGTRGGEKLSYSKTPLINAFSYKDGTKRSLIITNLDPEKSHDVEIQTSASARGEVRKLLLTGPINAQTPDYSTEQSVSIQETKEESLPQKITLPPASMIGFSWEI